MRHFFLLILNLFWAVSYISAQRVGYAEDLNLADAMLLCTSHKGVVGELVASKAADTSMLYPKLRQLALKWDNQKLRRDSVKVVKAERLNIPNSQKALLLVYFSYRGKDWDELLLLLSKQDYNVLDIANYKEVFSFDKSKRNRYHQEITAGNASSLYDDYFSLKTKQSDAFQAAQHIIRLVNSESEFDMFGNEYTKEDSLYEYFAYTGTSNPKRKYLEGCLAPNDKDDQTQMQNLLNNLKGVFDAPQTMELAGSFKSNTQNGTCEQAIKCTKTANMRTFCFVKYQGRYLLYNVRYL